MLYSNCLYDKFHVKNIKSLKKLPRVSDKLVQPRAVY